MVYKPKNSSAQKFGCLLLLMAGVAILISVCLFFERYRKKYGENDFDPIIVDAAKRHHLDPNFIKAVIWKESSFQPGARGKDGEIGLMQIIRTAAVQDWANENKVILPCRGALFDPKLNIEVGSWYLARANKYWRKKGYKEHVALALCEYNAGRSRADKWKPKPKAGDVTKQITFPSTRNYVKAILSKYNDYKKQKKSWKTTKGNANGKN